MFTLKRISFFIAILLFFIQGTDLFAQKVSNIDRLEREFNEGKVSAQVVADEYLKQLSSNNIYKCGTPGSIFIEKHKNQLSESTHQKILAIPSYFKSSLATQTYISVTGKFEISYETTGRNAVPLADENGNSVPDYVEWVGTAMDSSYKHEVITLGFPDPIPLGQNYEVYLADIGPYGTTTSDITAPGGTYIVIENDFSGFPDNTDPEGNQKGAVRATAAHEFKHAIQYIQKGWSGDADNWLEMDATLMEEVVYDEVNDYYNYLLGFGDTIFEEPYTTIIPGSYEDVTWALYFHERFGAEFWTNVWQRIESSISSLRFLDAINTELSTQGEIYDIVITESYLWHYATGGILSPVNYGFDERRFYPGTYVKKEFTTLPDTLSELSTLSKFSADFIEIDLETPRAGQIGIELVYEEPAIQLGLIAYFPNGAVETSFASANEAGVTSLTTTWTWSEISHLGIVFMNSDPFASNSYQFKVTATLPETSYLAQNYPNPFNPSTTISFGLTEQQEVTLEIFDYTGRLVRTLLSGVQSAGSYEVPFDASNLASGMYLYRLKTQNGVFHNKMLLIK